MTVDRLVSRDAIRIEPASVDPRFAAAFLYGSIAIVALAIGATWWLFLAWAGPRTRQSEDVRIDPAARAVNAAPLSVKQRHERLEYEQRQRVLLTSYAWIDPKKGIARIPLEKAMQRLAVDTEGEK